MMRMLLNRKASYKPVCLVQTLNSSIQLEKGFNCLFLILQYDLNFLQSACITFVINQNTSSYLYSW